MLSLSWSRIFQYGRDDKLRRLFPLLWKEDIPMWLCTESQKFVHNSGREMKKTCIVWQIKKVIIPEYFLLLVIDSCSNLELTGI